MFEIYKKTITLNGTSYELRPLSGRFLPKLYRVLSSAKVEEREDMTDEERGKAFLDSMSAQDIADLHEVVLETFKRSYPNQDKDVLEDFVSQNLMTLFGAVVEVNLNNRVGGK